MSDDVKTGEQHAGKVPESQKVQTAKTAAAKNSSISPLVAAVAGGALLIIGFFGGALYQKNHTVTAQMPGGGMMLRGEGPMGGLFGGPDGGGQGERRFNTKRMGNISAGTVKTVSAASISVTDLRTGSDKTYTINGDTKVYKVTQTASINDVKTGDWVLVTPSSTDANVAAQIHFSTEIPGIGGPTTTN